MADTIAKITSKIVDATGNSATRAFVGQPVVPKKTGRGIVYAIGKTDYVLSVSEYRLFVAQGAIARVAMKKRKKMAPKQQQTKRELIKREPIDDLAPLDSVPGKRDEMNMKKKTVESEYTFGATHNELLNTSSFILNYPKPDFTMEEPKHASLMDKKEDLSKKISGFFDRIGSKARDKAVESMTD